MDTSNEPGYAELCCKSNYSFLTGASHPHELIEQAAKLGLKAIAMTDEAGVYGMAKAYHASKQFPELKLLVGCALPLSDHENLTLIAKTLPGYSLMCRMLSAAHGGKEKGDAHLSFAELTSWLRQAQSNDLFVLAPNSLDCRWPELRLLMREQLFVTLNRFLDGHDQNRTKQALALKKQFSINIVATNDVHYHIAQRRILQDTLTAIRHRTTLRELGFRAFSNSERYLKTPATMHRLFADLPEAIANGLYIAEQCTFSPSELRYTYPSEWIPAGHTAQSYLVELTWQGAKKRYPQGIPPRLERQIRHELKLIDELKFADYFLTIYEIVAFAKGKNILCQGRGSAANSIVCYCLEITAIDPGRISMLFERFISAERGEPPDIDVDFEHERREEVIQHIYAKYGRHRAGMVAAVNTYRSRSALRDVAKAFSVPVGTLSAKKVQHNFDELTGGNQLLQAQIQQVAEELIGFPRHLSIHSGGFTLSAHPIIDLVPVEPARMDDRTIVQWDKYDLDYLGLLKVDILALGMLSALRKTLDLLNMRLTDIPAEDPATYRMIQRAETVGTFQIESRAQMSMLGRLQPENFYDLVVQIAIVRPGPIVGKMVHPYLKCRRGEAKPYYPDPRIKNILGKTLGIPLFQEQIMQLAIDLGNFSPGEADELRRAIAAWRSSGSVQKMGQRLKEGLLQSGLPEKFATQIFDQIKGFAAYGFPESHAASFALLAYASCYLKCHHPTAFFASMVNSQPLGFYANHTLIDEAKRAGSRVLPVDLNYSHWDCTVDGTTIQLGLRVVRGLSKDEAEQIISSRPFTSLEDFLKRIPLRMHVLERLVMGGSLEIFGHDRRHTLWQILEYKGLNACPSEAQTNLFANFTSTASNLFPRLSNFESICADYGSFNLSAKGHPMQALRTLPMNIPKLTAKQARQKNNGTRIEIVGLVIAKQRPGTAKGMMFMTLEDETGFLDTAAPPQIFERYEHVLRHHCFIRLRGILQKDGYSVSLLIQSAQPVFGDPYALKKKQTELYIEPSKYFS